MKRRLALTGILGFAELGFAVAASHWAYLENTFPRHMARSQSLLSVFFVLNPPSIVTLAFIHARSTEIHFAVLWLIVTLCNSILCAFVGILIFRRSRKLT